jgi:uncharacterized NAD(P)/FAD-binding protein YdhS
VFRHDPWDAQALTGLDPAAAVLLIGTGLTMVDVVISLLDSGHTGPIHAVSRRGLLPNAHADAPVPGASIELPLPSGLRALTRWLRNATQAASAAGQDWRAVIDGLRPHTQALWQSLSTVEQARFLRHLRPWWDVCRHRMAPEIARRIEAARASGQLCVHAGRVEAAALSGAGADLRLRPRGQIGTIGLSVDRVVNCTGPEGDITRVADRLTQALLRDGLARPDALALGFDVTATGAVLSRDGASSGGLFALGPLTKGVFWEITAVPDIRRQCAEMAAHLADRLRDSADRPAVALVPAGVRTRAAKPGRARRSAA